MKPIRNHWLLLLCISLALAAPTSAGNGEIHGFPDLPPRTVDAMPFSDAQIDQLLNTLDDLLAADAALTRPDEEAAADLWMFRERLQTGMLTAAQESRVVHRLAHAASAYPGLADVIASEQRRVTTLAVGKPAPDIVARDLEGRDLRLSDYRGRIVVIAFSGEWCGACRLEYPYQRLLLELYRDQPLTILGVDSHPDAAAARAAKAERGLTYRSWWDGFAEKHTRGPIASEWGVRGWPTTYVVDELGIIRFVNLRQEDLLKAVKQLMSKRQNVD